MDQVAVIDLVGGRPANDEIANVPASGHYLVTRDGNGQAGTFVNMINGDTLVWRNQNNEEQRFALRDVRRIYLNPDGARTAFRYRGTTAVGTAGQTTLAPGAVRVEANQPWTDTGIDVRAGELVSFRAPTRNPVRGTGSRHVDGKSDTRSPNYPVSVMLVGGFIGGSLSAPFPVGAITGRSACRSTGAVLASTTTRWAITAGFLGRRPRPAKDGRTSNSRVLIKKNTPECLRTRTRCALARSTPACAPSTLRVSSPSTLRISPPSTSRFSFTHTLDELRGAQRP
jgi:hypothetical protein